MEENDIILILVERIDSRKGEKISLSDLRREEHDLRVRYEGERRSEYLWRDIFPDQMLEALNAYGEGVERFVCPSNHRQLGGIL